MKEYLMTLGGVMILSTLIGTVCAEGNLKKYVRLLCALCLLCALITPLFRLLSEGEFDAMNLWQDLVEEDATNYEDIYHQALVQNQVTYAENLLKNNISEQFKLKETTLDVHIQIVSENGIDCVDRITVILRDGAILTDPSELTEYINETQGCECVIVYD